MAFNGGGALNARKFPYSRTAKTATAPKLAIGGSTAGRGGSTNFQGFTPAPGIQRQQQQSKPVDTGTNSGLGVNSQGSVSARAAHPAIDPAIDPAQQARDSWNGQSQGQRNIMSQDDQYKDETGAAQAEYENLLAQLGQQNTNYQLDNKNSLRNLGDMGNGQWNQTDKLTGYGNAFQQQQGDFASRGMLESSGYGTALNDMNRGFGQQRDDIGEALRQFTEGQKLDTTHATGNRDTAKAMSQRQALQRMASSLGL